MNGRILVTGALGQIGSELVAALRQRYGAEEVVASDVRMPPAHRWRPDDGPFEFVDGVKSLKNPEQFIGVLHVKPDSVVPYVVNVLVTGYLFMTDLNLRVRVATRKLEGVREQAKQNLPDHVAIGECRREFVNF